MAFDKKPAANPISRIDKNRKFYLLHGDDEAAIERAKDQIVNAHLNREEREENYFEIIPGGGSPALKKLMGDVLAELSTVSFLPDITRVVTLYTVNDFFDGKSGARKIWGRIGITALVAFLVLGVSGLGAFLFLYSTTDLPDPNA